MNPNLKDYIKSNFPLTKTDLFAVFLEKGLEMIKDYGFNCMVTMQSWMFLSSFEKFRKKLIETTTISNLLHMDNMVMKIAFGTSATVFRKINLMNYNSTFYHVKLSDVENDIVNPLFFNDKNKFNVNVKTFENIPRNPIAYWIDNSISNAFSRGKELNIYAHAKKGMDTGKNSKFLRYWFEVNFDDCGFSFKNKNDAKNSSLKWFPYNKGGDFRRWVGNRDWVVNWENDGFEIKNAKNSTIRNEQFYFKKSFGWSYVSSSIISFRYYPYGFLFDGVGCAVFSDSKYDKYILGFLNSKICQELLNVTSPTLAYTVGTVSKLPLILNLEKIDEINDLVENSLFICGNDYNDYEINKDFSSHPFLKFKSSYNQLGFIYKSWDEFKINEFEKLKNNERKLNRLFSEIYKMDIDCEVEDKYVSVTHANYINDVKSFISYAVGCMFGRYSLDKEGLQFAGGVFDINNYNKFKPDGDNIIPVLDSEYFEDDVVGRFVEFVKTCFGKEHLEENLDFIANALSKNKKPSREKIRDYMLKNFFNDHKKIYKKCPIYWQFSSGKENGFNCLVYMHRYEPSLVARIRTDYLHKTQKAIEQSIANCDNIINHSSSSTEISNATKEKSKLQKQLKETQEYDEALAHIANQNIEIDLDDGIKVNCAKFQNVEVSKEGEKSKKINLLK